MHYQEINEQLARGCPREALPPSCAEEFRRADAYLLYRQGKQPEWMEAFLRSNRDKLVETICRASVREGIPSIQGYREGYFNEIIQNANDLHYGEEMKITAQRDGERYKLRCTYRDKGFSLSNIYGFLNREMSDKLRNPSQTGTFGVGIKAFFKFAEELNILSNVRFVFRTGRSQETAVSGIAEVNPDWDGVHTVLELSYCGAVETEFNTEKLTELIDALNTRGFQDCSRFFITGKDKEMVFDIRSLLFMKLRSGGEQSLTHLVFSGSAHQISLRCEETDEERTVLYQEMLWRTGTLRLCMELDGEAAWERRCLYFANERASIVMPLGGCTPEKNRIYATYYLKSDVGERLCPSGLLFDIWSANIHRIDVGDSEEAIDQVYEELRIQMGKLYALISSEEAASLPFAGEISDAFHNLIARYLPEDRNRFLESPLNYPYCTSGFLPKLWGDGPIRPYVVLHREREEYDTASYQEGDIVRELRENYFEFVEEGKVWDRDKLLADRRCIPGVRNAYERLLSEEAGISPENRQLAAEILNYFGSVREFLVFAVSGRRTGDEATDAEADIWLTNMRDRVGNYFREDIFRKLLGRYHLNPAIEYDGSIIGANLSFKDYLFNGPRSGGILTLRQNEQYDAIYGTLKEGLLRERYTDPGNSEAPYQIRCIRPVKGSVSGWDGTYDYGALTPPQGQRNVIEGLDLLLERLAMDPTLAGQVLEGSPPMLFEKTARKMRQRKTDFKHYTIDYQQIIALSCLRNVALDHFLSFIRAVRHRSALPTGLREYIRIHCVEETLSISDMIGNILPAIAETWRDSGSVLDEYAPPDVEIRQIREDSGSELPEKYANFVERMTGCRVYVYRFASTVRRKITAYIGNGRCAVNLGQGYQPAAVYSGETKDVYIFCGNDAKDLQSLVIDVLEQFGLSAKRLELLGGYIHNVSSTKSLDDRSRRRNLARGSRALSPDWADIEPEDLGEVTDNSVFYRLLTARGSYDLVCPICGKVPPDEFGSGEETKAFRRRIVLLENESPETKEAVPFIMTVACRYCRERLRSTLLKAEYNGKEAVLTTEAAFGMHEKSVAKQRIPLSPVNVELMRKFRI